MLPCCAASLCDKCAKKRIKEENGKCHMCKDAVDSENLIPYRLLRDKVDKFVSISGYKRRQMGSSIKSAILRSPRGTSPPTPPTPPAPPPRMPTHPPARTSAPHTAHQQSHPQQPHSSRYDRHQEPFYDDRHRHQYSRSLEWGKQHTHRTDRTYISPSDDPLAAFQAAMAKMDYEKERSRSRSYYSPPRAYRKHSRPHRRERLESDIPPETREERERRLEFERNLRRRDRREESEVSWESRVSQCKEEYIKKGKGDRACRSFVNSDELQDNGGDVMHQGGGRNDKSGKVDDKEAGKVVDEEGGKVAKTKTVGGEVYQGDSTPSLSPESINTREKEGQERSENAKDEEAMSKDNVKELQKELSLTGKPASLDLCKDQ